MLGCKRFGIWEMDEGDFSTSIIGREVLSRCSSLAWRESINGAVKEQEPGPISTMAQGEGQMER